MIWALRGSKAGFQVAAKWLVRRFIDPDASFASVEDLLVSKRRNGTTGAKLSPTRSGFIELTSFDDLLRQYRLSTDPALMFLSFALRSPRLSHLSDGAERPALEVPPAASDSAERSQQEAFTAIGHSLSAVTRPGPE